MHKSNKEKRFIKKPIFEGGLKALRAFIKTNLIYPKAALKAKIEGTVIIKYTIDYKGKVVDTKIVKGLSHGCDEEATRLVKLLKFKTAKTRKIKIRYFKNIQIHFKISKKDISKITYNYLSKKEKKVQNKSSYNYTINIS